MIPSAKIAKRCREPPLKRLRKPRTFEPWKFSAMSSTASMLMPGAGMYAPTRLVAGARAGALVAAAGGLAGAGALAAADALALLAGALGPLQGVESDALTHRP